MADEAFDLIVALGASVTALAARADLVDLFITGGARHLLAFFFLKYICPLCLRGDVNDRTFLASLANPCARRMARRKALGLVTRILRLRTIFPCLLMWKPFIAPACIPIRPMPAPASPMVAAPPAAELTGCRRIVPPPFRAIAEMRERPPSTFPPTPPPGTRPRARAPRALSVEKN